MLPSIPFHVTGETLWNRMERAVERVNDRLRRTVTILENSRVPYAVVGAMPCAPGWPRWMRRPSAPPAMSIFLSGR